MTERITAGVIYRANRLHDHRWPQFDCFMPTEYGAEAISGVGDCWVVDEKGNVCPGYNVIPVPVHASLLGEVVRDT